jgi:alkanesulfonate monooxygenase SsuD/methylene tetrahydromethanopterin reductase-like flavin-dependent oxidoreductase (luciferase family)
VRIDLAGWTREATAGDSQAFFSLFERADRLGYHGVWFSEFRVPRAPWPYPSPLLLAAALLARTERLRVGTSVLVLPLHHPLVLAEEIAQVDFQSGGRLDVGIGRGTEPDSLKCLEIDPQSTRERFEQGARILRGALRGDTVESREGPWHFAPRTLGMPPVQRPHPPIYVAASTPESIAFAVREDFPLLLSLEPPETTQLERLDHAALSLGQGGAALRARSSLARYVCIGASAQAVQEQLGPLWAKLHAADRCNQGAGRAVRLGYARAVPCADRRAACAHGHRAAALRLQRQWPVEQRTGAAGHGAVRARSHACAGPR